MMGWLMAQTMFQLLRLLGKDKTILVVAGTLASGRRVRVVERQASRAGKQGRQAGRQAGHIKDQLENGAPFAYVVGPVASQQGEGDGSLDGSGFDGRTGQVEHLKNEGGGRCTLWVQSSAMYFVDFNHSMEVPLRDYVQPFLPSARGRP